jgi:hypothetical protein
MVPPPNPPETDGPAAGTSSIVCMLAEGSYFHGAAALCNSLIRQRFTGLMVVFYRGCLPGWAGCGQLTPRVSVRFVELDGVWHLTNLKPRIMQRIVRDYPGFQTLYYFDVDIVITCAWDNFVRWARHGAVLCHDLSDTYMPANHVFRQEWQALAQRAGYQTRAITGYFNAGCIGLAPAHCSLLDVWARLIDLHAAEGADMTRVVAAGGPPEFAKMDQDLLNAALMASDVPLALLGKEAMGSFPHAPVMTHAMIFKKPWLRNYLLDALKGFPPGREDMAFWNNMEAPIATFSPGRLRRKRLELNLARLLGRIRRRSVITW